MVWEKTIKKRNLTFKYSDPSLCRECNGYDWCPNIKNQSICYRMTIDTDTSSYLCIILNNKERTRPGCAQYIELEHLKPNAIGWTLLSEFKNLSKTKEIPEEAKKRVKGLSKELFGILIDPDKKFAGETFRLTFHNYDRKERFTHEFSGLFDFVSFLKKIPVVRSGDFPTESELEFPVRFVSDAAFPWYYDYLYKTLSELVIKNGWKEKIK